MGSLLLLLLALAVIGYPVRLLLARLTPVVRDLDLLQRFLLNIYCGGLVLYIVALLPFRAFTDLTAVILVISFALISAFIVCLQHFNLISNPAEWLSRGVASWTLPGESKKFTATRGPAATI